MRARRTIRLLPLFLCVSLLGAAIASAQTAQTPSKLFEPQVGQQGKDVVWVPTSQTVVDAMLDMTKVTPQDYVIDLGSGDGRTVIAAAKRGATALGIEYNPEMVELAKRNAIAAGVASKATFVKADLFESDFSKATVITMFLLPSINVRLRPTLLDLKPGTRIAANTFTMAEWQADETRELGPGECSNWCTALMWIVPAKVAGTWRLSQRTMTLTQEFQKISGMLGMDPVAGKLRGDEITFTIGDAVYTGKVTGNSMGGTVTGGGGTWSATRQ